MRRLSSGTALLALLIVSCSSDSKSPASGAITTDGSSPGTDSGNEPVDSGKVPQVVDSGAEAAAPPAEASTDAGKDGGNSPYPQKLSQTGLFTDIATRALGPRVRTFEPKYKLWSDGAEKQRWLRIPAGQLIDTTDMDYWKYPVGMTVWKEFALNGKPIETRMLRKAGPKPTDWVMIAYQWNADLTDAIAVPDGVDNANGTQHDIPATTDCQQCHGNMKDRLLGITAIQLSHSLPGVTLSTLITEGVLTTPPAGDFTIPGPAVAEAALGYLHANCGHCHNPLSAVAASVSMTLLESTTQLDTLENTTGYSTTVLQQNSFLPQFHIIEPGRPDQSELFYRISRRGQGQMPPIATEIVDDAGVATVRAFIESLPLVGPDAGVTDGGGTVLTDAAAHD